MLADRFNSEKFADVLPHMENILRCGLFSHTFETCETTWSPGMYHILGVEPYSVESSFQVFRDYILAEDRDRVTALVESAREQRSEYSVDFSIVDARGIHRRVHAETSVRKDDLGRSCEYTGVIKDVTESYFYKRALEQKVAQLDKTNRNLQEFVYAASHDLQEPLRKISTFVERLRGRYTDQLGDEGNMYVGRILNSSRNMQRLLEDLLSFSRLSFADLEPETVQLQDCMNDVLNDLEITIEETGAVIHCDPLPAIRGYPSQISQLFANLIGNALKFRRPGTPPQISIACDQVNHTAYPDLSLANDITYLRLMFADNGIGFEQEFAEKIFMIFHRLNGKSEYAGSGIGLSICKRIAENHHGFIMAHSLPGHGSQFTVLLPEHPH